MGDNVSHVDHLLATRDKRELANMVAALARDNASLLNRVHALEHELFWTRVKERNGQMTNLDITQPARAINVVNGKVCDAVIISSKGRGDFPILAYVATSIVPTFFDNRGLSRNGSIQLENIAV